MGITLFTTLSIYLRSRLPHYTTPANLPQIEITILHQRSHANLPQMEIILLHYTGTPANFPQMKITVLHHTCKFLRCKLPYYTTPANLPQMEITLLHHPLLICPRWSIIILHQRGPC